MQKQKIDTIVFDLGGVLVDFHPEDGMRKMGFSEEAIQVFKEKIFSGLWEACDRIPYEDAEIRNLFKEHVPGYEREVDLLWDKLHAVTGVRPYTEQWLQDLKAQGYRLLILSNYGKNSFAINSEIYDFLRLFDGGVISYEVQLLKPEPAIYEALAEKYHFDPSTAVFIDDRQINVDGALHCGYHALLFQNYEQASTALNNLLD